MSNPKSLLYWLLAGLICLPILAETNLRIGSTMETGLQEAAPRSSPPGATLARFSSAQSRSLRALSGRHLGSVPQAEQAAWHGSYIEPPGGGGVWHGPYIEPTGDEVWHGPYIEPTGGGVWHGPYIEPTGGVCG